MHSGTTTVGIETGALEASIASATRALLGFRQSDGHWVFELEADCTIPAEYVLLRHYLGEPVDAVLEGKIANYLRRVQGDHGGWPLVHAGEFDMSASVKAYFALKMIGDSPDAPHMTRAREAIRSRGGAIHSNVFTRFMLAMFGGRRAGLVDRSSRLRATRNWPFPRAFRRPLGRPRRALVPLRGPTRGERDCGWRLRCVRPPRGRG